ncbi:MAG: hypothetical protein AB1758_24200, partial [Candidatus Eremiobacterota bacterium]
MRGFRPTDFKPEKRKKEEPREESKRPERRREGPDPLVQMAAQGLGHLVRWGAGQAMENVRAARKLESDLLQLARRLMGILTVPDAVRELGAGASQAEAGLRKLARRGFCRSAISKNGQEIFIFEEHLPRLFACDYCDNRWAEPRPSCPS